MQLPTPGQTFQRKYKLQEILGRGGFAAVYRATDIEVGRDVAIKVLAPGEEGYSAGIASRFMREARVIAGLQDPHTITMFDFGRSDAGLLYMVFEYVRGGDLRELIRTRGALDQATTMHILEQVLQSLREAHAAGVLHRDIKPANILIYDYMGDSNRVKLLDFGIAKAVAGSEAGINITRDGAMIGTPRYMSPEQIYGGELTTASDLYSLGLVAYEMLTGAPAIEGNTSKEAIREQLSDAPVLLPRTVRASEEFCTIVEKMTARDPARRYSSAQEALRALEFVEEDATDKMMVPQSVLAADAQEVPPTLVEDRVSPTGESARDEQEIQLGLPRQPSRTLDEIAADGDEETPMSMVQTVAIGLAVGAGVVALLVVVSSLTGDDEPPPEPQPTELQRIAARAAAEAEEEYGAQPSMQEPAPAVDAGAGPFDASTIAAATVSAGDVDAGAEDVAGAVVDGCGEDAPWEGMRTLGVSMGLQRRTWTAYVPKRYAGNRRHRVVLMFHKTTQNSRRMIRETKYDRLADRENFVVLSLDATDSMDPWNDRDDAEFAELALSETSRALCLDTSRVYAIGHGSGGRMVRELACEMPLSAIASTGSGQRADRTICTPDPPVPFIRFHGLDDRYVPAEGGPNCTGNVHLSLEEHEELLRENNGCNDKRRRYTRKRDGTCYTWKCEEPFVSCHLDGGHDWNTAPREGIELPGCVSKPARFPIGDVVWRFFERDGRVLE